MNWGNFKCLKLFSHPNKQNEPMTELLQIANGIPIEKFSLYTGLSIAEIKAFKKGVPVKPAKAVE